MKALDHPKDKMEKQNICGNMYEIPCHNCELKYISEIGRKFNTRLIVHQRGAKNVPQVYIRSEQKSSETCFNKSTVTDHTGKDNHVIYLEEEEEGEGGLKPPFIWSYDIFLNFIYSIPL